MTTSADLPLHEPTQHKRTQHKRTQHEGTEPRASKETPAVSVPPLASGMGNPSAHCIADSAGGLTFDLAERGPSGDPDPDSWDAALVLRRRGGRTVADEVRLPLVPAADGRLRAVLPSTMPLPEGRWDAFAATATGTGTGEPERIVPGVLDLRSLVDRRPDPDRPAVGVRVPYATKHGNLSVRSWLRAPHAEAGEIRLVDGSINVQGRLYGSMPGPGALVEARCRRDRSVTVTMPASVDGRYFAFTLAYKELAEFWEGGVEPWDLWLRPTAEAGPVRIGRILDDVPDKKHIFTYPVQPLGAAPYGPAEARPYYTLDNDLTVAIHPADRTA
jgi:hypothetical protein